MHIPQTLTTHRRIPNRLGVLALVAALAAGLLAGSGSAAAQPGKPGDRPLHPLSQKGLIAPVYLLRPDEVAEVARMLNTNSGLWNAYQVTPSGSSSEDVYKRQHHGRFVWQTGLRRRWRGQRVCAYRDRDRGQRDAMLCDGALWILQHRQFPRLPDRDWLLIPLPVHFQARPI